MWRWLYSALLLAAWPWVHVRLRWRARREPAYAERIGERFGHVGTLVDPNAVWFHTVSAGEAIAAAPVISELADRFPSLPVLVTTMTPTGSAQVRARLGSRVSHCYAPYDFGWVVRRFFGTARPRLVVLMETELWPNLIDEAARRGVPVLLVNARLSERSAKGYARLGGLTRAMLERLCWIACQYPDHARRFEALGAPPERVVVHGSVKFDATLPKDHAARVEALRRRFRLHDARVWIAASTHVGEETVILSAHDRLRRTVPDARLVLVPRHPARADAVAGLCERRGRSVARVSVPRPGDGAASVIVGDTMGDLVYLYGLAAVAFVGGSLVDAGGHNPIEPALCRLPVLMGPSVFNFAEVVAELRRSECLVTVAGEQELVSMLSAWLCDPALRQALGERAAETVAGNAGASHRLLALIEGELEAATDGPVGHFSKGKS